MPPETPEGYEGYSEPEEFNDLDGPEYSEDTDDPLEL